MGNLINSYIFSGAGWDFEDTDMEQSWSLQNNTITSNKMNCNGRAFSSTVYYGNIDPMGASASNTAWVLWATINFSELTKGSLGGNSQLVCLSDNATSASSTNQDGIGTWANYDFGGAGTKRWLAKACDGSRFEPNGGYQQFGTATLETGVDYYLQMIRLSATTCNCGIYSNYDRSTLIEAETPSVASTVTNLRYIKMVNLTGFNAGADMLSTVNGVNFADGVTTAP